MTTQTAVAVAKTAPVTKYGTIKGFIEERSAAISQLIPKHLDPERLMKVLLNSIYKTPALQDCTPSSLLQCALTAAELGLEPGGALGHAYLVPYKTTCTFIIGYRGLIELMRRSGQLASIRAVVAHERDRFSYREGIDQIIDHEPCLEGEPGPLRFVYAVAKLKDGSVQCEFMTKAQVDAIKGRSRASGSGPWVSDYEEMAKKTVIRRIAKVLPLSSEAVEKALEHDNDDYIDGAVSAVTDAALAAPDAQADAKEAIRKRRLLIQEQPQEPLPMPEEASQSEAPQVS